MLIADNWAASMQAMCNHMIKNATHCKYGIPFVNIRPEPKRLFELVVPPGVFFALLDPRKPPCPLVCTSGC